MSWIFVILGLVLLYLVACHVVATYKVIGKLERIEDMLMNLAMDDDPDPGEEVPYPNGQPKPVEGVVVEFPPQAARRAA